VKLLPSFGANAAQASTKERQCQTSGSDQVVARLMAAGALRLVTTTR
jgi:hypothetical protein